MPRRMTCSAKQTAREQHERVVDSLRVLRKSGIEECHTISNLGVDEAVQTENLLKRGR